MKDYRVSIQNIYISDVVALDEIQNFSSVPSFFEQLGMLLPPFSFTWVFQILIAYSNFLRNVYLRILLFSIGYFRKC